MDFDSKKKKMIRIEKKSMWLKKKEMNEWMNEWSKQETSTSHNNNNNNICKQVWSMIMMMMMMRYTGIVLHIAAYIEKKKRFLWKKSHHLPKTWESNSNRIESNRRRKTFIGNLKVE